jgi:hypothetical protein
MKQKIPVTALLLDARNPRMEVQPGHRDAIRALFAADAKQMLNLAEDIVQNGLNPVESIGASPGPGDRFTIREGNRRVAALCALCSPDLVKGVVSPAAEKTLRALAKAFGTKEPEKEIECEVLPADEWDHWVTLRHTGANEGRGLVPWGPTEKARYLHRAGAGKKAVELQFLDWYANATGEDQAEQSVLKAVPVTNLRRLLEDSGVRKRLGISVEDGLAFSAYPPGEMFKWARRVVHDLGEKKIAVRDIYDSTKMGEYLDKFSKHELPDPATALAAPVPIEPVDGGPSQFKPKKPKKRPPKAWSVRELGISPDHSRLRDIIAELQKLPIEAYPNIHSVMLRVFGEMTVEDYLDHHKIQWPVDPRLGRPTFATKVAAAANHLESTGGMRKAQLVPARKLTGTKSPLGSALSLHQFVHNKNVHPSPGEVTSLWKNIGPFIAKLHER